LRLKLHEIVTAAQFDAKQRLKYQNMYNNNGILMMFYENISPFQPKSGKNL